MENISLNNGQLVTIASNKDMLEIIEENLSYELAKYISEILWNQEEIDGYITMTNICPLDIKQIVGY